MIKAIVIFYLAGLSTLYASYINHFDYPAILYYLWEKSFGAGFFVWAYLLLRSSKKNMPFIFWALIVSSVRLFWQTLAYLAYKFDGVLIEPGDDWRVSVLFLGVIIATGALCLGYKNRLSDFLDKYSP